MSEKALLLGLTAAALLCSSAIAQPDVSLILQSPALTAGDEPIAIASGDLDGDGNIDLVVANDASDDVSVFWGNGDGTFTPAASPFSVGTGIGEAPVAITIADMNGDHNPDIVTANEGTDSVSVLLGHGGARTFDAAEFTLAAVFTVTVGPAAAGATTLTIIGTVPGAFPTEGTITALGGVAVAIPFTRDGNTLNLSSGIPTALTAASTPVTATPTSGIAPEGIVVGDFNGDGKLDVATPNVLQDSVTVLLGNGDGTLSPLSFCSAQPTQICHSNSDCPANGTCNPQPFHVGSEPDALVAVDLNNDGLLDLVVANSSGGTPDLLNGSLTVLKGVGAAAGVFVVAPPGEILSSNFNDPVNLAVADLNADGKPDVVVVNDANDSLSVLLGNGDLSFQSATPLFLSEFSMPESAAVADLNGDGILDIASSASLQDKVSVFLGQGSGQFATAIDIELPANSFPFGLTAADFDKNGKPDLAVADMTVPGQASVLLNASGVTLAAAVGPTDTTVTLTDAGPFPTAGTIMLDDEQLTYTGKQGSTLMGLIRGARGTVPVAHQAGTTVIFVPSTGTCVGDCNGDHSVSVDEILTIVNIALGNLQVSACPAGDPNGNQQITVDELLTAVNNVLSGCTQ